MTPMIKFCTSENQQGKLIKLFMLSTLSFLGNEYPAINLLDINRCFFEEGRY